MAYDAEDLLAGQPIPSLAKLPAVAPCIEVTGDFPSWVSNHRRQKDIPPWVSEKEVAGKTYEYLASKGAFYRTPEDRRLWCETETGKTHPLEFTSFADRLAILTGVNPKDELFSKLRAFIAVQTSLAPEVKISRFAHYDRARSEFTVNNMGGKAYRRERGGEFALVPNGDSGVFFFTDSKSEAYEPDFAASGNWDWFYSKCAVADSGQFERAEQLLLNDAWIDHLFLPEAGKPLQIAVGRWGSGKTSHLNRQGIWLLGSKFGVSMMTEEDDTRAALCNNLYVVWDNADGPALIKWAPNLIASYVTGGRFKLRVYYTTNEVGEFDPIAALSVTAADPRGFTKYETAQRSIVEHFEAGKTYDDEEEMYRETARRRNGLWGEKLKQLARVVDEYGALAVPASTLRLRGLAATCYRTLHAQGKAEQYQPLIDKLKDSQIAFSTDHYAGLITCLRAIRKHWGSKANDETTTADLFEAALMLSKEPEYVPLPAKTEQGFRQMFHSARPVLESALGARITDRQGHAGEAFVTITDGQMHAENNREKSRRKMGG